MGSRDDVDFNLFPAERVELPGYATVDLATEVEVVQLRAPDVPAFPAVLRVENLFDRGLRPGGWLCRAAGGQCSGEPSSSSDRQTTGGGDRVLRSFPHDPFAHPLSSLALAALLAGAWSCAETSAPLPPPEEVVVVLNTTAATLSLVPVAAPTQVSTVPLGASDVLPVSVATRGATAVVPLRAGTPLPSWTCGQGCW